MNQYCAESEDSILGGFCMNSNAETDKDVQNRELQAYQMFPPSLWCDPQSDDYQYYECDCTKFDAVTLQGTFSCFIYEDYCFYEGMCGSVSVSLSRIPDGSGGVVERTEYCYDFITPKEASLCYGFDNVDACTISVNNVDCKSCEVQQDGCNDYDCTNTAAGIEGNGCLGDYELYNFLLVIDGNASEVTPSPSSVSLSLEPASTGPTPPPPPISVPASIGPTVPPQEVKTLAPTSGPTPGAPSPVSASIGPTPAPQEVATPAPTSRQTPGGGEVPTSPAPVAAAPTSKPSSEPSAAMLDPSPSPTEEESSASTWSRGVGSLCAASAAILAYYVAQ
jgi:hypothetical protein